MNYIDVTRMDMCRIWHHPFVEKSRTENDSDQCVITRSHGVCIGYVTCISLDFSEMSTNALRKTSFLPGFPRTSEMAHITRDSIRLPVSIWYSRNLLTYEIISFKRMHYGIPGTHSTHIDTSYALWLYGANPSKAFSC